VIKELSITNTPIQMKKVETANSDKFKIRNMLSCVIMVCIFELMDMLSYSGAIMENYNSSKDIDAVCMILYIYPTISSMIFYNIFTTIPAGIVSSAIVENFRFFHKMSKNVRKNVDSEEALVTNSIFLFFVTGLLFAFSSIIMMKLRLGRLILQIPKAVVYGIFATIGIIQIPVGLQELMPNGYNHEHLSMYIIAFAVVLIVFVLQKRYPNIMYIMPLSMVVCMCLFYSFFIFQFKNDLIYELILHGWLHERDNRVINPSMLFNMIELETLQFGFLLKNLRTVLVCVFFSLLHVTYNLPSYKMDLNIEFDYSAELGTQGYTNLFTFIPCYFISCYSGPFYRSGGTKRIYGIISGLFLVFVALFGCSIRGYVPKFLLCMPPLLIGSTMIYDTLLTVISETKVFEQLVVFVISLISYLTEDYFLGVVTGILIHLAFYFMLKRRAISNEQRVSTYSEFLAGYTCIKIDFILCFMTMNKFKKYDFTDEKIVIDLLECPAVDWIGSDLLYDAINKPDKKVVIVGVPFNFNEKRFNKICKVLNNAEQLKT
ncbi:Sulfate Permease (SulP) Family, partial [Trachipleistophora hominis]